MMAEWSHARACIEDALKIGRSLGRWFHIAPWMDMGLLCLWEGDYASASRYLHEADALAEHKGDVFAKRVTVERLARLAMLEGHPEIAIERLLPLLDGQSLVEFHVGMLLSTLAWAYLEMGDADRAESLVTDAVQREAVSAQPRGFGPRTLGSSQGADASSAME